MLRRTLGILMTLLLTSCNLVAPVPAPTPNRYTLSTIPPALATPSKTTARVLLIPVPSAAPGYDTNQMAYSQSPYRINYFASHQWVDVPSHLFWMLTARTLEQSGKFSAVVTAPYVGPVDSSLDLTMFSIIQDFQQHPSVVIAQVRAEWVSKHSNSVVTARTFSVTVPAKKDTPEGGVQAANKAVEQLLEEIRTFVLVKSDQQNKQHEQKLLVTNEQE